MTASRSSAHGTQGRVDETTEGYGASATAAPRAWERPGLLFLTSAAAGTVGFLLTAHQLAPYGRTHD